MTVNPAKTIFKDPRVFNINRIIKLNDRVMDLGRNFIKRLKVKVKAKKSGIKNARSWKALAEVKVFG